MKPIVYKEIDIQSYYRRGVYTHFTKDVKCSMSVTNRLDVTAFVQSCKNRGTHFYLDFLYLLTKVLNSKDDYKMAYLYKENKTVVYEQINVAQYVFHEDTETFTIAYTEYTDNYKEFYGNAQKDLEWAKNTREYGLDLARINCFDASYLPWISYDSMNLELPDGYFYYLPIVNWSRYRLENGRLMMPVTVRLNHAACDGFHISRIFVALQKELDAFNG